MFETGCDNSLYMVSMAKIEPELGLYSGFPALCSDHKTTFSPHTIQRQEYAESSLTSWS